MTALEGESSKDAMKLNETLRVSLSSLQQEEKVSGTCTEGHPCEEEGREQSLMSHGKRSRRNHCAGPLSSPEH